jgi:heptosyltransferase-2
LRLYQVLTLMKTVSRHKYIPLRHEADYCLDLGRAIGVEETDLSVELFLTEEERRVGAAILKSWRNMGKDDARKLRVGIHLGHGHSAPNWKPERYMELGSFLLTHEEVCVVLTGNQSEAAKARMFQSLHSSRVINLAGRLTLRELIAVVSHLDLLVSASTGPMHIAAGVKVPTLSLFCPLTACSPQLWGPLGNRAEVVLPPEEYCRVKCPGDPHVCDLEGGIHPTTVYEKAVEALSLHRKRRGVG